MVGGGGGGGGVFTGIRVNHGRSAPGFSVRVGELYADRVFKKMIFMIRYMP